MKRIFLVILACVLIGGCRKEAPEAGAGKAGTAGSPAGQAFSFGSIPATKPVSHTFVLTNNTGRELRITGRTNSCGCITSAIDRETIPPGESARLEVTFDPAGYHGRESQFVYLNTDDPDQSVYKFTVEADVE